MRKWCRHASSFIFDRIIIKITSNQDRHQSSVKFDFGPNQTIHFGVTCPWVTKISYFQTWISLKPVGQYWSNVICSIIGLGNGCIRFWGRLDQSSMATESPHWLTMGKMISPPFLFCFFYPILFILAGNKNMHKISDGFEFRSDRTTDYGVSCPWGLKNFP